MIEQAPRLKLKLTGHNESCKIGNHPYTAEIAQRPQIQQEDKIKKYARLNDNDKS